MVTEVVAALVRRSDGRFLIARRPAHKARGGLWEFVGGKVEPGESGEAALVRECREELDISLRVGSVYAVVLHEYPDLTVRLTLYNASIASGEPKLLEHSAIAWISPGEISNYEFCPADESILRRLIGEDNAMQETYEFLKAVGTYYLATVEDGQPRVRPFGTVDLFEGKLYIQTGKRKPTYAQIKANPKIEICAFDGNRWLRLAATAVEDDRVEARKHMLDAYPSLRAMYDENDGNTVVFALTGVTATFASFTAATEVHTF